MNFGYPGTSPHSNSRLALVQVFFFKGHHSKMQNTILHDLATSSSVQHAGTSKYFVSTWQTWGELWIYITGTNPKIQDPESKNQNSKPQNPRSRIHTLRYSGGTVVDHYRPLILGLEWISPRGSRDLKL